MFNTIDLFAGPGGITCGFKMSGGYRTLLAVEFNQEAADTFEINHVEVPLIRKDIRKIKKDEILNILGDNRVDIVLGGPPCEGFSLAGKRNPEDKRNSLFWNLIHISEITKSRAIMMENVPGLLSMRKEKIFKDVLQAFRDAGFKTDYVILESQNFGVPQVRKRLFIFAFKEREPGPLIEELKKVKKEPVTSSEALSDLPTVKAGEEKKIYDKSPENNYQKFMRKGSKYLQSHKAVNHRKYMIERFSYIKNGKGMKEAWDRMPEDVRPQILYAARCRRLDPDKPSYTITSHCLDEIIHPRDNRAITPREAARLQSFPDNYFFVGKYVVFHSALQQDRYEQIGDAVPPLLAKVIANKLKKFL